MRLRTLLSLSGVLMCGFAGSLSAQTTADEIELFHQGITSGCIYQFKTDPKLTDVPQELRSGLCTCIDDWLKTNNLNDAASVKANEPAMPKVMTYCLKVVVGD